jgi:hypothetical protein
MAMAASAPSQVDPVCVPSERPGSLCPRNAVIAIIGAVIASYSINAAYAGQAQSASRIRDEATGSFLFVDPGSNHPITVWFCRPSSITRDTRLLFVMHGSESRTSRQACEIASPYLQPLNAIVLAPQFSEQYFPGDTYMFGNMVDAMGNVLPKSMWALIAIECLFDLVRETVGLSRPEYDIVGFSGGAQFVHRLVLFVPEARFRRAVAAGAGRYAFPSWSEQFPYGLTGSPIERSTLASGVLTRPCRAPGRSRYERSRARGGRDGARSQPLRQRIALLCDRNRRGSGPARAVALGAPNRAWCRPFSTADGAGCTRTAAPVVAVIWETADETSSPLSCIVQEYNEPLKKRT